MKAFIIFMLLILAISSEEILESKGDITNVILYRGQAIVTRSIALHQLEPGQYQLIVKELPASLEPTSLFANGSENVSVRSVRYRSKLTEESPVENIRKLQQQIQETEAEIRKNENSQLLLREQKEYLSGLKNFQMGSVKKDIHQNTLNPQSLIEMMNYIFTETTRIQQKLFVLSEDMLASKEKLTLLKSEIKKITVNDVKEVKEAVIFFEHKDSSAAATINIGYLVNNATWSPSYNVRSESNKENITIEYNALVQQTSGEDWKNVNLTLSTASIEMSAESPSLSLMKFHLENANTQQNDLSYKYAQFKNEQEDILKSRSKMTLDEQLEANNKLNEIGNNIQIVELVSSDSMNIQKLKLQSGLTVNYQIEGKVNIPSHTDQQMVEIKKLQLKQEIYNISIPLLFEHIYRKVKIKNTYEIAFLEGNANVYLDGQFVGNAFLPMTAKGQKFTFGLGVDTQTQATRELISKKEYIERGNKIIMLEYRLIFDNYKEKAVDVRVFDRVPGETDNINVVVQSKVALSKDEKYEVTAKKSGILRWDISIPEESNTDAASFMIEYSVKLEFDKEKNISVPFLDNERMQSKSRRKNDFTEEPNQDYLFDYAEESLEDF